MNTTLVLSWFSRALALATFIFWIVMFILEGIDNYLVPGILLILALVITIFIGWQNEIIAGSIFIIIALIYFIIIYSKDATELYYYALIPFIVSGIVYLFTYFYSEKKEMEEDDF